ncbi:iron chelate uptake ABC transporter family permease subunit [Lipingzhangella sp. LS1_29]|uniref:Iron chelate uptake ABC transporter family permease subunit n=1 Tax=Lipingzhangella rawalii TaxID=2055835 RepID=A0ABU2H7F7_9ACTN|nr:iron chelate uptake ABC transporter family permease subunit [Lipingzhangella rawalii]MDS1271236.1 iron chelate uptake ABC transporter family permease subunit [Lipingzhangella rawalii]
MTPTSPSTGTASRPRMLRLGPVAAWPWQPRTLLVNLCVLAVLLVGLLRALLAFDDYPMGLGEVLATLVGRGEPGPEFVVFQLRLPRALTGMLVGAALGMAGAIMQGLTRNPLASPDVLGITWGAAVGAVAVIVTAGSAGGVSGLAADLGLPVGALLGGLGAAAVVFALSWRTGLASDRLLLVGVATSLVCANLVYWAMTWTDLQDAARAQTWLSGSLHAADWTRLAPTALALGLLVPAALFVARPLAALGLGEDTARGLGVRVTGARLALLGYAALLVCVATSAAGPIAFVALAAPQIALRLARRAQPPLVGSALVGAALTVVADQLAAGLFAPTQLPVGVFTAILGAPYLMYLVVRRHRQQSG